MRVQFLTAREAANLITDNATIAINGFVGIGAAEEVQEKIKERYEETNTPKGLTLYYAAGQGDGKDRALNLLNGEGLLKRVVGGHWNLAPKLQKLALDNKIEAYNFPQGVISHMFRSSASGEKGTISKIGLDTFVDPTQDGGKLNSITKEDLVKKIELEGEEYLYYLAPKIDFAIIRGTFADEYGNISLEEEVATLDETNMAIA